VDAEQSKDALVLDLALGGLPGPEQDVMAVALAVSDGYAGLTGGMEAIGGWCPLLGTWHG
jgi:hypothetical protein